MARRPLQCWWGDLHVAQITSKQPWNLRLRYTDAAQHRWPANTPALSCSLPVQRRPLDASAFLRGLLPEGRYLQAVADLAGVATNDTHGLLARYGRDVAGALVITDDQEPPTPDRWKVEPYTDETLAAEVSGLDDHPLGARPDSELSIAGLQNKLLLVELTDGSWGRPVHGYPSTHILKLDDERYPGLITAEADCLRLAQHLGLTCLEPTVQNIGGRDCIIVRRYDRTSYGGKVQRIHQEDACQALDIDPQTLRGRAKYETAGGPSLGAVARLLREHAQDSSHEMEHLIKAVTFTVLIGNADAHGKNISLLHDDNGYISLAPLYDTVPTMLWPNLRRESAVSVNRSWSFEDIAIDDLVEEAHSWGLDRERARPAVTEVAEEVAAAATSIMSRDDLVTLVSSRVEALLSTPEG